MPAAPWLLEGLINSESLQLYISNILVPALRLGDIVVMDRLRSHKSSLVRRALKAIGAQLFFLPKYSPVLNLIEMFFSKLTHGLREARVHTHDAIYRAFVALLFTVRSHECTNFFVEGGLART